jgi:RNA polymerase sigma-70 factor (family 1)
VNNDSLCNEKELLDRIAHADEAAFATLFKFYKNKIYSVAYKLTHSTQASEEIVQDIFLKVWQRKADLPQLQNFGTYLFVVTKNHVYKVLKEIAANRKVVMLHNEDETIANYNSNDYVLEKEYNLVLIKAIERLPVQQKQVYTLTKDHGLKREEVATLLRVQPETVKFHLAQAMKNIRSFCLLYINLLAGCFVLHYFNW